MFGLILLVMLNIKEYQVYQLEILFQRTIMKFIKIYPSRSFFSFFLFGATPVAYGSSQARGQIRAAAASQSNPQLQQHWIWVTSATYAIAHSNTRSLTHWARPGIQPASSWTLCQALNPLNHNGNANGYNFFFLFLAAPRHMKFQGQGSDLRCSCHLHRSCIPHPLKVQGSVYTSISVHSQQQTYSSRIILCLSLIVLYGHIDMLFSFFKYTVLFTV